MSRNWIEFPRIEGKASRQAHADLPEGAFEREIGRDGFFGPAAHLYHRHAPTGWTSFEGTLRPRAFDAKAAAKASSPLEGAGLLQNANCAVLCRSPSILTHLIAHCLEVVWVGERNV